MNIFNIEREFRKLEEKESAITNALSLIYWDSVTGAPKEGMELRSKMNGILSGEAFAILNSKEMTQFAKKIAENKNKVSDISYACAIDILKEQEKLKHIEKNEYEDYAELCSKAEYMWEEAKDKSDTSIFLPYLEKIIEFQKKLIEKRGFKGHPYNTLLEDFEPGITVEILDKVFNELKDKIVSITKAASKKIVKKTEWEKCFVPINVQREFNEEMLKIIGYNFDAGMLKESEHPFTIGFGPSDIRITTHYYERNFLSAIFSSIHECGHAIYEQNIEKRFEGTRIATGVSMGIHESQSRFYENIIGRSREFWEYMFPIMMRYYEKFIGKVDFEEFLSVINRVEFSKIRTESDELTYTLHIILRYEIEKKIFEGKLTVNQIEDYWNKLSFEILGVKINKSSEGILQDSHWAGGLFGYFPSYAIGNIYSAQIAEKIKSKIDFEGSLKRGNIKTITEILKSGIHIYGKLKEPKEIIEGFLEEEMMAEPYINYLSQKFGDK